MTYYHSKFPLQDIPLNKWLNLSVDVVSFAADFIKHSYNFRTIDSISISGNIKIRKIFTMKNNLLELSSSDSQQKFTEDFVSKYISNLPKHLAFPSKVEYENINLCLDRNNEKTSISERINLTPTSSNVANNNSNVNRASLIEYNIGKNLRSSVKRNNFIDISTKYRNLNKMLISAQQQKEEKENKLKNSIQKSRRPSVKGVRINNNHSKNLRQKSSEPRTKVRGSQKLIDIDINNFKPENSFNKKGHSSSKASKNKIMQSNEFKEINFDRIEKIKEKIELIQDQEEDSIMKFDLDKEFEMRIYDFEFKNEFVRMEDTPDNLKKSIKIEENKSVIQEVNTNKKEENYNKTNEENIKYESIFDKNTTGKTFKDEVKFNNYEINSSKRNSDKKDNVEIIEEIYDFDNNVDEVNVEENDLKLNLEDSFFKEDIA